MESISQSNEQILLVGVYVQPKKHIVYKLQAHDKSLHFIMNVPTDHTTNNRDFYTTQLHEMICDLSGIKSKDSLVDLDKFSRLVHAHVDVIDDMLEHYDDYSQYKQLRPVSSDDYEFQLYYLREDDSVKMLQWFNCDPYYRPSFTTSVSRAYLQKHERMFKIYDKDFNVEELISTI